MKRKKGNLSKPVPKVADQATAEKPRHNAELENKYGDGKSPAIKTDKDSFLGRLRRSIKWSRKAAEVKRRNRLMILRAFLGQYYGDDGAEGRTPLNLLSLAFMTLQRQLVARQPRVMISTEARSLKAKAAKFQNGLNSLMTEVHFERKMKYLTMAAFMGPAIAKVAMDRGQEVDLEGELVFNTDPYLEVISLDDFIFDMRCHDAMRADFIGNNYRVPLESVQECKLYDKVVRQGLKATHLRGRNDSEEGSDERADSISTGYQGHDGDEGEYITYVELMEVYLPQTNTILVLPKQGGSDALWEGDWEGPKDGPYRIHGFIDVPDNPLPHSIGGQLYDLHELVNTLMTKLGEDAEREKTVGLYRGQASNDALRIKEAANGEMVLCEDPDGVREAHYGGASQPGMAFTIWCRDMFSYSAGNLDALGGLGQQADTLGQEELISGSANKQIAEMQDRTVSFTTELCRMLGWYEWTDPVKEREVTHAVPGFEDRWYTTTTFTPEDRDADFYNFNIVIDPYSMKHETPEMKAQKLSMLIQQVILPLQPFMQQQGQSLDVENILRLMAKYQNITDIEDVIKFIEPSRLPGATGEPFQNSPPANTTRTYKRINQPGANMQGKHAALISSLLGAGVQPKEQAGALRNTA